MRDHAKPHQEAVEQAVVAEDAHPGVHANQDRRPGRHHDQQHQHGLGFLARLGDGIGHREADHQARQGAEEGHFQRAQVGRDVQLVVGQQGIVAQVHQQLEFLLGVGVNLRVRRNGQGRFREADLHDDEERQQEEQAQPQERNTDDQLPAAGDQAFQLSIELFHARSTTPLSSSHQT
ncbi:hypothetical protein D9M71_634080 [compost metagenome]